MTTEWFILTRAVHFGACLLFFGVFAFDRFVAVSDSARGQSETADYWRSCVRRLSLLSLPLILLSGLAWFALVAMAMSGEPLSAEILKEVWAETQFGTVWKWRLIFWLAAVVAATFRFFKPQGSVCEKLAWLELLFAGGLLGSLAWAGHGQETSPRHLFADVLHLLVAGFWPAGLLPFALFLGRLRRGPGIPRWFSIAVLVRRFSAISLGSVALLAATGLVNSWFLVGSFANLFQQPYGRWLVAKIILFCFIVTIGAVNLLRLKPRLAVESPQPESLAATAAQLQFNVRLELVLATVIVIVVAILGILPPAIH